MAYDTKVLLASLAQNVAKSKTLKEAYSSIVYSANVEGMQLPTYEEAVAEIQKLQENKED